MGISVILPAGAVKDWFQAAYAARAPLIYLSFIHLARLRPTRPRAVGEFAPAPPWSQIDNKFSSRASLRDYDRLASICCRPHPGNDHEVSPEPLGHLRCHAFDVSPECVGE